MIATIPETDFFDPGNFGAKALHLEPILRAFAEQGSYSIRTACISAMDRGMIHEEFAFGNHESLDTICSLFEGCISGILPYYTPSVRRVSGLNRRVYEQQDWYERALEVLIKTYFCVAKKHAYKDVAPLARVIEFTALCQNGVIKPLSDTDALKLILGHAVLLNQEVHLEVFLSRYLKQCDYYLRDTKLFSAKHDSNPFAPTRQIIQYLDKQKYRPEVLIDLLKGIEKLAIQHRCQYQDPPKDLNGVRSVTALRELELMCRLVSEHSV